MTIQRRILAGHLVVVCLLLIPAAYAVRCLGVVARRTHESLQVGLQRLRAVERLNADFDRMVRLKGVASALGDPAVRRKAQESFDSLRKAYVRSRPQILSAGLDSGSTHLDTLLDLQSPLESSVIDRPWLPDEIEAARGEIASTYEAARRWMLDATISTEIEARRALRLSVLGFIIAIPLAAGSTVLAVRSMRRPLRRLISATMAVSAGKFGIAVPVSGDDEVSRLTNAFNKMSENLAVFEKMTADFLSVASHELRSPLTCIKGYVGALRATLPASIAEETEIARYLDRIDHEADLMAEKVSELLTFGLIEAGQLRLDPREIMTEGFLVMVGEAFKPISAERGIGFKVDVVGVPSSFIGDPDRLNQVLLNLLDNAFKYTLSGGMVTLKARGQSGMLEIEVADTGPGIPPDQLDVIFEKYARARSQALRGRKGTGLGLAVARGIVLAHGGTIGVTSEPGQGSRFVVRLPLNSEQEPARSEEEEVA